MYLSVSTRPDITYAVGNLARYTSKPTKAHWTALKRVLRYLKGTIHYGILYAQNESTICVGYSDSDWAGDVNDRKSTSGYLFQVSCHMEEPQTKLCCALNSRGRVRSSLKCRTRDSVAQETCH